MSKAYIFYKCLAESVSNKLSRQYATRVCGQPCKSAVQLAPWVTPMRWRWSAANSLAEIRLGNHLHSVLSAFKRFYEARLLFWVFFNFFSPALFVLCEKLTLYIIIYLYNNTRVVQIIFVSHASCKIGINLFLRD